METEMILIGSMASFILAMQFYGIKQIGKLCERVTRLETMLNWMDAYVRAVQDMQTQKETDELNAAMRKQKAILEKEIAETFRIETEKLRAISEKITAQQAAMIIPDPTPTDYQLLDIT